MKHYAIIEKEVIQTIEFKNASKEMQLLYMLLILDADYNGYIENAKSIIKEYDFKIEDLKKLIDAKLILKSPYLKDLYIDRLNPISKKTTKKILYSKYDNLHKDLLIDTNGYYYFNNEKTTQETIKKDELINAFNNKEIIKKINIDDENETDDFNEQEWDQMIEKIDGKKDTKQDYSDFLCKN